MGKTVEQKKRNAERMHEYRAKRPGAADVYGRKYYAENSEKMKARSRAWAIANPEKRRELERRRLRANPALYAVMSTKHSAKCRGLTYTLPKALALDLLTDYCFYCGRPPVPRNGIDRADNARGYEEDNVVTACYNCNRAKSTFSRADFESWAIRLSTNLLKYQVAGGGL